MKSLYRRYRPTKLSEVVGQPQVTEALSSALAQGKINHAYLFIGPRGCGKTSVARIFAHEVNGFKYEIEDEYVDIVEIDGASNRGIDNIRELREKVAIAPTSGKYKVYIIDEVHMLTREAFNALLKTLEEPPAHVIFIMATTDAYKVPVTITSRAQTFTFKLADFKIMQDFLRGVCGKEKIKISDDALGLIVKRGGGSFRDSLSLLDQISTLSEGEISKELVIKTLGLPEDEKISELLLGYTTGDVVKITTLLRELLESGVKPETLAEEMIRQIMENPQPELIGLLAKLPEVQAPFAEAKLLAVLLNNIKVNKVIEIKKEIKNEIKPETVPEQNVLGANTSFSWDNFLEKVKSLNAAVYLQLNKVSHEVTSGGLEIYPEKRIVKTVLSKENNLRMLVDAAGMRVTIHEPGEKPENAPKDVLMEKISGIMGGEVIDDGGGNPFQN